MFHVDIAERISSLTHWTKGLFICLVTKGAHCSKQFESTDVKVCTWISTLSVEGISLRAGAALSRVSHVIAVSPEVTESSHFRLAFRFDDVNRSSY